MQYLGFRDLLARWVYTRQGLYKFMAREDFPAPAFILNQGHTKVWELSTIEAYERRYPELTDETTKRFKTKGYFLSIQKGKRSRPE